jgi:hypothetical protein
MRPRDRSNRLLEPLRRAPSVRLQYSAILVNLNRPRLNSGHDRPFPPQASNARRNTRCTRVAKIWVKRALTVARNAQTCDCGILGVADVYLQKCGIVVLNLHGATANYQDCYGKRSNANP